MGTEEYARGFGSKVVMIEVDPKDVVSVPHDCSNQKLRCCRYKVVAGYDGRVTAPLARVRNQKVEQRPGKPPVFKAKAVFDPTAKPKTFRYKGKDYLLIVEDRHQRVLQTVQTGKILVQSK